MNGTQKKKNTLRANTQFLQSNRFIYFYKKMKGESV